MSAETMEKTVTKTAPGPSALSAFGALRRVQRDPIGFLGEGWRKYGDLVRFKIGPVENYLVADPEAVQQVLQTNNRNYNKQTTDNRKLKLALGEGLVTSDGDFWRRQRRIAQPAFHRERLQKFAGTITASTDAMSRAWRTNAESGRPLDVAHEMMRLTLEIILQTMFSTDGSARAEELGGYVSTAIRYVNDRVTSLTSLFEFPERLPTARNREFRHAIAELDRFIFDVIKARRNGAAQPGDLLTMLMEARDLDTGETMTNQQLRDEAITIFSAGHETTANALAWTFYLLSTHPEVMSRVRTEVDRVLGERTPTVEDLAKLEYTGRVIKESMRLYPPVWIIPRNTLCADVLSGYDIPAGAQIYISPFLTHRHPRVWENPEGFDPDRFLPERIGALPRYAYLPFGGGPRMCIGNNFAMMEAQLILASVTQQFRLELVPGQRVELEPLVTLRPKHGIEMTVHSQRSAS